MDLGGLEIGGEIKESNFNGEPAAKFFTQLVGLDCGGNPLQRHPPKIDLDTPVDRNTPRKIYPAAFSDHL